METKHIRIDSEEIISAKKEILQSQINTLHLIKRIRNYNILRKKELALKAKIKQEIGFLKSKINLIISTMPKEASEKKTLPVETIVKVKKEVSPFKEKINKDLQKELDEIKAKLAKLG
ncbi:MAG: hypothetical protein WC979_04415 [Candidatus Pacearchaeota archaeon]|jgi:hypothetical protein